MRFLQVLYSGEDYLPVQPLRHRRLQSIRNLVRHGRSKSYWTNQLLCSYLLWRASCRKRTYLAQLGTPTAMKLVRELGSSGMSVRELRFGAGFAAASMDVLFATERLCVSSNSFPRAILSSTARIVAFPFPLSCEGRV